MRVPPCRSSPSRKGCFGKTISPTETSSRTTISAILRPTFSNMTVQLGRWMVAAPLGPRVARVQVASQRVHRLSDLDGLVRPVHGGRAGVRCWTRRPALLGGRAVVEAPRALAEELADARLLADALAQEVELGAAHLAAAH